MSARIDAFEFVALCLTLWDNHDMSKEALQVAVFFVFLFGAGLGFYLAKFLLS